MKFLYSDLVESVLDGYSWEEKGLEFVWSSDWCVQHKMQSREVIFRHKGKTYCIFDYRQGNDFSGWEPVDYMLEVDSNGYAECDEVRRVSQMVVSWESADAVEKKLLESMDIVNNCPLKKGDVFVNNKTEHVYRFHHMEIDSETLEPMVSYMDTKGNSWTRPYSLFCEKFTRTTEAG